MRRPLRLIALTLLSALLGSSTAHAAEIHVLCSNGFKAVMEDLAPQFERATANMVRVTYGLRQNSRRIQGVVVDLASAGADRRTRAGQGGPDSRSRWRARR